MSRSRRGGASDVPPEYAQIDIASIRRHRKDHAPAPPPHQPPPPTSSSSVAASHYHSAAITSAAAAGGTAEYDTIEDLRNHHHHHHHHQSSVPGSLRGNPPPPPSSPPDVPPHQNIIETGLNPIYRTALGGQTLGHSHLGGGHSHHPSLSTALMPPGAFMAMTPQPPSEVSGGYKYPPAPPRSADGMDSLDYMLAKLETKSLADTSEGWGPPHDILGHYYNTISSQQSLLQRQQQQQQQQQQKQRERSGRSCCGNCGNSCCYCKVILTVAGILLVVWGITVPLYFYMNDGKAPWVAAVAGDVHSAARDPESSRHMEELLTHNGTVLTAVNCSVRIVNQRYSHFLASPFSGEYQALKLKLETMMSIIFQQNSHFNKAAVTRFRPGEGSSVIVDFVLMFNEKRADIKDYSFNVLNNYLMQHWTMLGTYQIELNSLKLDYIQNECSVNNGGCSHLCFWSVLSVGYECHCPQQHSLMTDQRTCFPSAVERVTTTTSNPCGEDHFMCKSGGNCIPSAWLCDDVSDCLLGEDEAGHVCADGVKKAASKNKVKGPTPKPELTPHPDPDLPTTTRPSPTTTPFFIWHNEKEEEEAASTTTKDFAIPSLAPGDNQSMVRAHHRSRDHTSRQFEFFGRK